MRVTLLIYMERGVYCRKCDIEHQRPVGRRCEVFQAMAATRQMSGNNYNVSVNKSSSEIDISQPGTSAQGSHA